MDNEIVNQSKGFNVSQRYAPVSTKVILENLKMEGYEVNSFSSAKVRKITKQGFQKHLLRISRNDLDLGIDGLRPEIILINSHDGSCGLKFLVGIYRFACANGLVVGSSYFTRNIRHVGDVYPKVLNAIDDVKKALPLIAQDIKRFGMRQLTQNEKETFALKVAQASNPENTKFLNVGTLLEVRRNEDMGSDLFTILNVVQENMLIGNLSIIRKVTVDNNEIEVVRKMRKVKSMSRSTEINQAVWDIATQIAA